MTNFYAEKLDEINNLKKSNPKQALKLVKQELEMPYIPEKYEKEFQKLESEINFSLVKEIKNSVLSQDKILDYFWSGDEVKEAIAIDNLKNQNIRFFLDDIKKWIHKKGGGMSVAFVYEILVEQQVDINLDIQGVKINPAKDKSILDHNEVIIAFKTIISLTEKEPSIQKAMADELKIYLLKTFPKMPSNGTNLAKRLFVLISKIINGSDNLSSSEKKLLETLKG